MATLFRRANGVYYYVLSVKGRRVWRSTRTTCKEEAEKNLQELRSEFLPKRSSKPTISEFREQYLPYARTNLAPTTIALYDGAIRAFIRHLGDKRIDHYSVFEIERFKCAIFVRTLSKICNLWNSK